MASTHWVLISSLVLAVLFSHAPGQAGVDPRSIVQLMGEVQGSQIELHGVIRPGYHINAHQPAERWLIPTALTLSSAGSTFADFSYPEPIEAEFAFAPGKTLLVYEGKFTIRAQATPAPEGSVQALLRYQACDDTNCLPPVTIETTIGATKRVAAGPAAPPSGGSFNDPGWLEAWLVSASLPAKLGMVLLLGLGLNLTPCVYPLISVTLSYFGGQSDASRSTFPLASAYVLGITLSFAALGTTAALAGGLFGAPLQNPAVLIGLAVVLVGLAGSSFGLYEIRAPSGLVNKVGAAQTGFGGAFLMGLTMGIIAAPCIGPVVLGLLIYVGSEKDAVLGFSLFATMGLGMGLPYIALASAAGSIHKLPRSGEWLRWTNRVFGVVLMGMAYYFLTPLIPTETEEILLPLLVATGSIYLGFLEPSGAQLRGFLLVKRTIGVTGLAFGIWLALPGAPMAAGIRWQPLTRVSLSQAIEENRPAVIEFGAEWCLPCVEMEHSTFIDPNVSHEARRFTMLQADVTEESPTNTALLEEFAVAGVPTIIFYDATGVERRRLVGFVSARRMLDTLQSITSAPSAAKPERPRRPERQLKLIPAGWEATPAP